MDGFRYTKITAEEFRDKLRAAGFNLNDFLYHTGRRAFDVQTFLGAVPGREARYQPTMGDVILLELAADPAIRERIEAVTVRYVRGEIEVPPMAERKPKQPKRAGWSDATDRARRVNELHEVADGTYGDNPAVRGAARELARKMEAHMKKEA